MIDINPQDVSPSNSSSKKKKSTKKSTKKSVKKRRKTLPPPPFVDAKTTGRPGKHSRGMNKSAYELALLGLGDEAIAGILNIRVKTFYEWQKKYPSFSKALKKGKEKADQKVVESLYKRACGYSVKDTKFFQYEGEVISQEYERQYIPDIPAIKFWLTNRHPDQWRERRDVTSGGEAVNIPTKVIFEVDGD